MAGFAAFGLDALDKIIRGAMGLRFIGNGIVRPGAMAFLAIIMAFDQAHLRGQTHEQIGEHGLLCHLRILDAQRPAFRAPDGLASRRLGFASQQDVFSPLEFIRGHLHPNPGLVF